jgi:hypothetical protein
MSWNFSISLFDDAFVDDSEHCEEEMRPLFSRREEEEEFETNVDEEEQQRIAELEQMRQLNLKEAREREEKKKRRQQRREENTSWMTVAKAVPKRAIAPPTDCWISPKDLQCQHCKSTHFLEFVQLMKNKPIYSVLCTQCRGSAYVSVNPVVCKCGWDKNSRLTMTTNSNGFHIQCRDCSIEKSNNILEMSDWNCTNCKKIISYLDNMFFKINPGFNEKLDKFFPICEVCFKAPKP